MANGDVFIGVKYKPQTSKNKSQNTLPRHHVHMSSAHNLSNYLLDK